MQVVILAAGRGKRMQNLTDEIPKPMLKLKGKPILEHKIKMLPEEIDEIILVVGYGGDQIIRYFKHYFAGRRIIYVYQHRINGTGGALHLARSVLRDKFMVMMGDDLYHKQDLQRLMRHNRAILGKEVEDPSLFGIIKMDRKGYMVDVIEKPKKSRDKLANTGVYVIDKKFFDYELVPIGNGEFGLPQTLAKMARQYKIKVEKATIWHAIGKPADLRSAEKVLRNFS